MNELEQARAAFLAGIAQLENSDFRQAETSLRRALLLAPKRVSVMTNLSAALLKQGKFDEAQSLAEEAIALDASNVQAMLNRALCQSALHCHEAALGTLDAALSTARLDPALAGHVPDIHLQRGNVLCDLRRVPEALASYDKAISLDPDHIESWLNRSSLLRDQGRYDEAIDACRTGIRLSPGKAIPWQKLGLLYHDMGRYGDAIEALEHACSLSTPSGDLLGKLLTSRMHACDWQAFDHTCEQVLASITQGDAPPDAGSLLPIDSSARQQHDCVKRHMDKHHPAILPALADTRSYQHARLRIGYLSSDFHEHATAHLMAGFFERHDRTRFETFAFSFGPETGDAMRLRLRNGFEHFIDVRDKSDLEIARLVRSLEIDIAVDLKGLTGDSRPGIFSYRAAPVQVGYLGYPGSMGADYFDYLIADRVLIPVEHQQSYAEKIVYLPDSYQANDCGRNVSRVVPTRAACGLPEEAFVFCCFNNNYKITPDAFDIWMDLLEQVPGSVLWLMQNNVFARDNLRAAARKRGMDPDRLVFATYTTPDLHLARQTLADLFLDTFYYNAHTTCSDALWVGLPVVTCAGRAFPARVAASLLHAVGLPQLVTQSRADYAALALDLASDADRLAQLRQHLQSHKTSLPLFNTERFTRNVESAYETMHARVSAGAAPDHLYVS